LLRDPENTVCIVTFTKDSADELRTRTLTHLAGNDQAANRLRAGTFHGLCFRMLQAHKPVDLKNIISEAESFNYAERIIDKFNLSSQPGDVLAMIERSRVGLSSEATRHTDRVVALAYIDLLRRNKKLDFTDLVLDTLEALRIGAISPMPVKYLLVDEYQDTDELQYRWVKAHSAAGTIVTVVGDDDQAIFTWRYALGYAGMMRFAEEHEAEKIVLGVNYRCRSEILNAAGSVIVRNTERVKKTLVAARGEGGKVEIIQVKSVANEAALVSMRLSDFNENDYSAAVISRTKRSLLAVAALLESSGIPIDAPKSASLLDSEEARLFFDLADCVTQGSKRGVDHALSWTGLNHADLENISKRYKGALISPTKAELQSLNIDDEAGFKWGAFSKTFIRLRDQSSKAPERVSLLIEGIASWMDAANRYSQFSSNAERVRLLCEILSSRRGTLHERVQSLRNLSLLKEKEKANRRVVLTTMHASKGLEWDRVHIIRAETGVCPSKNSSNLPEERRLFYVAMTRARDVLTISATATNTVSQFVAETGVPIKYLTSEKTS
jgi:superfamily I DNA/RNA helicase